MSYCACQIRVSYLFQLCKAHPYIPYLAWARTLVMPTHASKCGPRQGRQCCSFHQGPRFLGKHKSLANSLAGSS
jgi:hypothetical protein